MNYIQHPPQKKSYSIHIHPQSSTYTPPNQSPPHPKITSMQKHENSNSNTQFPSPISIPTPRKKPSAHQNRRDKSSSSNPSKIVFWTERKTNYRGSSDPGAASRKFQSETENKKRKKQGRSKPKTDHKLVKNGWGERERVGVRWEIERERNAERN